METSVGFRRSTFPSLRGSCVSPRRKRFPRLLVRIRSYKIFLWQNVLLLSSLRSRNSTPTRRSTKSGGSRWVFEASSSSSSSSFFHRRRRRRISARFLLHLAARTRLDRVSTSDRGTNGFQSSSKSHHQSHRRRLCSRRSRTTTSTTTTKSDD